jgi:hypothetical protein
VRFEIRARWTEHLAEGTRFEVGDRIEVEGHVLEVESVSEIDEDRRTAHVQGYSVSLRPPLTPWQKGEHRAVLAEYTRRHREGQRREKG